jgi:hypothetical protein
MKFHPVLLIFLVGLQAGVAAAHAASPATTSSAERLGTVSFPVGCVAAREMLAVK